MSYRKKLIEVALPLNKISEASAKEKSIRQGHPSTLHLWWSRKPLATARAVLFASLVDDPSEHPEEFLTEKAQEQERERLFRLIEQLVLWENSNNQDVLAAAHVEIRKSTGGNLPPMYDPFAGGGSLPLEAQRLGLEAYASDLSPVSVLINKALIELPPKFAGQSPVNPNTKKLLDADWRGAKGLANDVRYYGQWMRNEAEKRIGHLYPKAPLPKEYGGGEATVIAWLWVHTVTCPNPACSAQMPLASKWWLSKKKGKYVWVEPIVDQESRTLRFEIRMGEPEASLANAIGVGTSVIGTQGKKTKATFGCIICNSGVAKGEYIDTEANKGKMGFMPLAIVAATRQGRIYLPVDHAQMQKTLEAAQQCLSLSPVHEKIPTEPARGTFASNAQGRVYGFKTFADYFTPRQLVILSNFSDLIPRVREKILIDVQATGLFLDEIPSGKQEIHTQAYADAIVTYLALGLSKLIDYNSIGVTWSQNRDQARNTFTKQGFSMAWDYAEVNPFANAAGDLSVSLKGIADVLERGLSVSTVGSSHQADAASTFLSEGITFLISTDPPYYDNVGYADLADFFYVWLRRSLDTIYPELFGTMLSPKAQELVATPHRFGGSKIKAQQFFETSLGKAFKLMREIQHPGYPLTVYYAFKQAESEADEDEEQESNGSITTASTGWETMLEGLIRSGFTITGTWPIRTERMSRSTGIGTNALASSIALVCRPRAVDAPVATRREFLSALRKELPEALRKLQHGSVAPVDLAQASIGPGMSIYSRYSQVVESDGTPLRVRTALQMINQELDAALAEQEGEYDRETRWAIAWFEQYGMQEGEYGVAETLSKAKNMSVAHLEHTGLVESRAGKVRLRRREELSGEWTAPNSTVWEVAQRMIYALLEGKGEMGGEIGTANILRQALSLSESVRDLLYRLYTVCERKGWAQDALAYNGLVTSWTRITDLAHRRPTEMQQATLF